MGDFRIVVGCVLQILDWLIIIKCIISWFPQLGDNIIARYIDLIVEPLLEPVRKILNKSSRLEYMPVDFSPIIVILILNVLSSML